MQHYLCRHVHVCEVCRLVLPREHLLTMHILERHDSFFATMAAQQPMVVCVRNQVALN